MGIGAPYMENALRPLGTGCVNRIDGAKFDKRSFLRDGASAVALSRRTCS